MSNYYQGSAYGAWGVQSCHKGPIHVMTIGQAAIYAGSRYEMNDQWWDLRIRISETGAIGEATDVTMDERAAAMLPESLLQLDIPPTVDIMWPDFAVPELGWEWWENLVKALEALPKSNVGIYCVGGHGRTGTVLAILASLSGQTDGDPVAWVRANYCEETVESAAQLAYVQDVTGVPVRVRSAFAMKQDKRKTAEESAKVFTQGSVVESDKGVLLPGDPHGFDPTLPRWRKLSDGRWVLANDVQFDEEEAKLKSHPPTAEPHALI